jgi:putative transposase
MMSPNDKYTSLVSAAGYLPLVLSGEDYLELLPVKWRAINDYGIRIDYRTYDCGELGPYRREHSGIVAKKGLWEVHYDPYDLSKVFVRTMDGWFTVPWTHRPMVTGPFADFTWQHARRLAAEAGLDNTDETDVAHVLDDLLTRAQAGPADATNGSSRAPRSRPPRTSRPLGSPPPQQANQIPPLTPTTSGSPRRR